MSFSSPAFISGTQLQSKNSTLVDQFSNSQEYFNFPESREEFVRKLFANLNKKVPSSMIPSGSNMLNFDQLILYKTLPCPNPERCSCKPREVVTKNQYNDKEYQCPFYHHIKDQRRVVLANQGDDDFGYQANYFDSKATGQPENYSYNYFESMFHPLYYKMFQCKRIYCKQSAFCPFFHNEEEKNNWSELFKEGLGRERVEYVKDKKKYYEGNQENMNIRNFTRGKTSFIDNKAKLKQALPFTPTKMTLTTTTTIPTTPFFEFSSPSNCSTSIGSNSPRDCFEDLSFGKKVIEESESRYNHWNQYSDEIKLLVKGVFDEIFIN